MFCSTSSQYSVRVSSYHFGYCNNLTSHSHKAVILLHFLVCNGKAGKFYVTCYYILDFCFRCYQYNIISGSGYFLLINSKLLCYIRQKRFKQNSLHFVNIKVHCTDQLHYAEHLKSVPRVLRIPSI